MYICLSSFSPFPSIKFFASIRLRYLSYKVNDHTNRLTTRLENQKTCKTQRTIILNQGTLLDILSMLNYSNFFLFFDELYFILHFIYIFSHVRETIQYFNSCIGLISLTLRSWVALIFLQMIWFHFSLWLNSIHNWYLNVLLLITSNKIC